MEICDKCKGHKFAPYTTTVTNNTKLCQCNNIINLAWECPRCHKINAPWKSNCDCLPFNPISVQPSCNTTPYNAGPIPINRYFPDPFTNINFDHKDLKK